MDFIDHHISPSLSFDGNVLFSTPRECREDHCGPMEVKCAYE